jgi:hypothetical protein
LCRTYPLTTAISQGYVDLAPVLHAAGFWYVANLHVPNLEQELAAVLPADANPHRVRLFCAALRRDRIQVASVSNMAMVRPRDDDNDRVEELSGTPLKKGPGAPDAETPAPAEKPEVSALGASESDEEMANMFPNKLPCCPKCGNARVHSYRLEHDIFHAQCGGHIGRKSYGCGEFLDRLFLENVEVWRYGPVDQDPKKKWFRIDTTDRKPNPGGGHRHVRRWSCRLQDDCEATIVQTFPDGKVSEACVRRFLISERWIGHHTHGENCKAALVLAQEEDVIERFRAGGSTVDAFVQVTATAGGAALKPTMKKLQNLKDRLPSVKPSASDADLLKGLGALAGTYIGFRLVLSQLLAAGKTVDGVGVLVSFIGVVDKRAGLIIALGGNVKMLRKWVNDCISAWRKAGLTGTIRLDIFVDGQWGWARLGRTTQVLLVTLPHPDSRRGYVTFMVVMDVKSMGDYVMAMTPFAETLAQELERCSLDMGSIRWHCDEEDALTMALESFGGEIVGCRFHKLQNAQLKAYFPKRT